MKRILIGIFAIVMALPAVADDGDKTTTSKPYVDTQIETTQVKIPAAGTQGVGEGTSVITYTNTAGGGVIGERGLYTGGTYSAGDADKLITASALNNTFTNIPTTDTTTLQCANPGTCTLWTIVDQTAYGVSSSGIDLSALLNATATSICYKRLSNGNVTAGTCSESPSTHGDWGVVFDVNGETVQVNGISACSTVNESLSGGGIPTNQSGVQSDYESNMAAAPTSSPVGGGCYCKANDSAAGWVFSGSYSVSYCAYLCATSCAGYVQDKSVFRGAVFGVN